MINPWTTHRLCNALVTGVNLTHNGWCEFKSKGTTFGGWIDSPKFQVGDRVTIYVQFSITMDKYIVDKANKKRARSTEKKAA